MNINGKEINIDDVIALNNKFLKKRKNNLLLSDYQIEILKQNDINYEEFSSLKDLLFCIEEILNDGYESPELEDVSKEISELLYYNYTNK